MSKEELLGDVEAERSLLGACMLSMGAVDTATGILVPSDFRVPRHQQLFAIIVQMRENGEKIDVVTVAAQVVDGSPDPVLDYLHELQNATPSISAAKEYAEIISGWSVRRKLLVAGAQITEMARGRSAVGMDPARIIEEARGLVADIDMPVGDGEPDEDVDRFIEGVHMDHEWLVEGFLEKRDRMIVTGREGSGKSVFIAQIAVQVAAGIHPWRLSRVEPRNVLYIDLENSNRQMARRLARLRSAAEPNLRSDRLRIIGKPGGINLTARADKQWLIERCRANETELLVIGPLYRMFGGVAERGDVGGEDMARKITASLDEVRIHCNTALLMETHAPHGNSGMGRDLRPFGSSVWMRWPEFGFGLRGGPDDDDVVDVEHWRGPRDERSWPRQLTRLGRPWMWTPTGGFYTR